MTVAPAIPGPSQSRRTCDRKRPRKSLAQPSQNARKVVAIFNYRLSNITTFVTSNPTPVANLVIDGHDARDSRCRPAETRHGRRTVEARWRR